VLPANEPIAAPPAGLSVLSFSRRRHIDLQRVTTCLCPPLTPGPTTPFARRGPALGARLGVQHL
jgi:hypothetical protein